ncbi:MAG: response regulator transcription factor [Alphaproteobacteria bacterium]|nr:response regulator transcription factor [Alphaproteobacteria bacterium]
MAAHILVIDDDARLRELLRKFLSEHGYRISTARDAAEARGQITGIAFDLLIVDIMLPGEDGMALTEALRRTSGVPILMLTALDEPEQRIAGLERGADDYLVKPFEPRELLLRIGNILRRSTSAADVTPVRLGALEFDLRHGILRSGNAVLHLTSAESQLLGVFARQPGVVLSREALSEQTGGVSTRSIDVQINRLRRKIEPDPRTPRYLQTVWGAGYVLRAG